MSAISQSLGSLSTAALIKVTANKISRAQDPFHAGIHGRVTCSVNIIHTVVYSEDKSNKSKTVMLTGHRSRSHTLFACQILGLSSKQLQNC